MITIKDISILANTSRGTVDRVLNGRGNVNEELAQKILKIAEEYNYKSNPFAKALVNSKRKNKIGVVINSKGNRFFDAVLAGIYDTIEKYHYYGMEIVVKEIKGYNEQEQLNALDSLLCKNISALAITPMNTPSIVEKLSMLSPLPIVTLNSDLHLDSKLAFIGCDYINSGRICGDLAAIALPKGGKIAIVTGSFNMLGHNERIQGFEESLSEKENIQIVSKLENNDDDEVSFEVTAQMVDQYRPDLVYFCAAGTEGGIQAVKASGRDIKVITVDDTDAVTKYLNDGTVAATVTQQPYLQGSTMVEILFNYLFRDMRPEHVHNYMQNQVKLRSS